MRPNIEIGCMNISKVNSVINHKDFDYIIGNELEDEVSWDYHSTKQSNVMVRLSQEDDNVYRVYIQEFKTGELSDLLLEFYMVKDGETVTFECDENRSFGASPEELLHLFKKHLQ